ncbi:serine/threonine-protein kinase TOR-like isoform X1 [Magnolia sinica]|uniref:serine/threonine-protein kinase TOR-like isoform X1 n=1 Tax=Magnolia sinica TaxID=86752 RepID=UPI002657CFD0|nr:serine/threonine-protein kinase TOR-like isoform X1 [Magnolia sinica]XP_058079038.1 serine/threonine-protein kinase TOR-like isoform X1 [Magnolia sinica]
MITMRIAFKPTSTIARKQHTVTRDRHETELIARGRHDPCVVPRAVPMVEAMVALVILDQLMVRYAQCQLLPINPCLQEPVEAPKLEIVEKLLIAAVADADVSVRQSVFLSLHGNGGFDEFLAQADSLSAIFVALNDEDFDVREFAISVTGRLSEKNPAYVLHALRRHLIQLLMHLEQSANSKCREESDKLLGCLIRNLMLH